MDWSSVASTLLNIGLPALGNALLPGVGGIGGQLAAKAIAGALGVDATPEAVSAAVTADPDAAKTKLAQLDNELAMFQAEVADRQSARSMYSTLAGTHSPAEWTPIVLTYLMLFLWMCFNAALIFVRADISDRLFNLLYIGFGNTGTLLGVAWAFWFGTTRGAQKQSATMQAMAATTKLPDAVGDLATRLGAAAKSAVQKAL